MQLFLNKKGQSSIELVFAIPFILIITFGLIISSLQYYTIRAEAAQTNYEVGRFVSQMPYCNTLAESNSQSLSGLLRPTYIDERKLKITIHKTGSSSITLTPTTPSRYQTTINVYCPANWDRTIPFRITTENKLNTSSSLYLFPTQFFADSVFMVEFGN